jgi:hypothetical protein
MTTLDTADIRTAALRVPRRRGALGGFFLVILGAWAALAPFVGPYLHFAFTPDKAWTWTSARGWLEVLPGCVIGVAGLILLLTTNRIFAVTATWYAIAGGAWLVVGPQLIHVVNTGSPGNPIGSSSEKQAAEWLVFFYGLGALVLVVAATLHGRLSMRSLGDVQAARTLAAEPAREVPVAPAATTAVRAPQQRAASRWHFPPARRGTTAAATPADGMPADRTTAGATAGPRRTER